MDARWATAPVWLENPLRQPMAIGKLPCWAHTCCRGQVKQSLIGILAGWAAPLLCVGYGELVVIGKQPHSAQCLSSGLARRSYIGTPLRSLRPAGCQPLETS